MGYPDYMHESLEKVEDTRSERIKIAQKGIQNFLKPLTAEERELVLRENHPDYQTDAKKQIRIGPNKGETLTTKVVELLESYSRLPDDLSVEPIDYETDVLIIGGGGAGCQAATRMKSLFLNTCQLLN